MDYAELCQHVVSLVRMRVEANQENPDLPLLRPSTLTTIITLDEAPDLYPALNHLLETGAVVSSAGGLVVGEDKVPTAPVPDDNAKPVVIPSRHEVRFYLPGSVWARWSAAARAVEFPLATWIRLKVDGVIAVPVTDRPSTVPPDQPAHGRVSANSLGAQLHGLTGGKPFKKAKVAALANLLGVTTRVLYSAIGSLRAFKRLERSGDEYRWVDETK